MAFDAFLIFKVDGGVAAKETKGETQDATYKKDHAIELRSFSFGANNIVNIGSKSGGAGSGKVDFKEFRFTKGFDSASTGLFATMCAGGHYGTVELHLRKSGAASAKVGEAYLKVLMKMAFVTDIEYSGSESDDSIEESVNLAIGAIQIKYRAQDSKGSLGSVAEATWSRILNTDSFEVKA